MSPADMRASAFCSICASDIIGEVVREPLGKMGALVAVCSDCRTERRPATTTSRGYVPMYPVEDAPPLTTGQHATVRRARNKNARANKKLRARNAAARLAARIAGDE